MSAPSEGPVSMPGKGRGVIAGHDGLTGSVYVHWEGGGATWENPYHLTPEPPPESTQDRPQP